MRFAPGAYRNLKHGNKAIIMKYQKITNTVNIVPTTDNEAEQNHGGEYNDTCDHSLAAPEQLFIQSGCRRHNNTA